ncbi:MAG: Lpg1974 family pore-forming outer membrane protein [Thermoguttaceae bacterium]|nr:Lpg1974 family pore-forming outer membrane protein [Thermoguttaceae bacterium]MDW8077568.1 Lpg1974 family pore-forming outer membrane protein [Thermoguttaceae bacterium]
MFRSCLSIGIGLLLVGVACPVFGQLAPSAVPGAMPSMLGSPYAPAGYLPGQVPPGGAMFAGFEQVGSPNSAPAPGKPGTQNCDFGCECPSPKWSFFGDIIYLCPSNQEVAIAVPADGPIDFGRVPVQAGPTLLAEFEYEPGFRVGGAMQFTECSQLRTTFTWLEASTNAWGSTTAPFVMWPMVTHPELDLADRQFLDAGARYLLDIELYDVDWVRVLTIGPFHRVDFIVGGRYAGLSQELRSFFVANGLDQVATDVNYNGGGIRVGLEGEWFDTSRTWLIYAKSAASFTAGEFRCGFRQDNNLGQRLVETSWKADRVVSMLDLEVGMGWQSRNDALRLTAGYMVSGWHNVITVPEYIDAVRANSYTGIGDFMTFDGFVGRVDFRF